MRIFPESLVTYEQFFLLLKKMDEIFANMPLTLTCEARASILKHAGFRGTAPQEVWGAKPPKKTRGLVGGFPIA